MNWPNDADGDVFRNLDSAGFDFNIEHIIDFNIDFKSWPLSKNEVEVLNKFYPSHELIEPDEGECDGYAQFQVKAKLTYELVIELQSEVALKLEGIGGYCESWGLWES